MYLIWARNKASASVMEELKQSDDTGVERGMPGEGHCMVLLQRVLQCLRSITQSHQTETNHSVYSKEDEGQSTLQHVPIKRPAISKGFH